MHGQAGNNERPQEGKTDLASLTGAEFAAQAEKEIESDRCYCGAKKSFGYWFCKRCLEALPWSKQEALYSLTEEAYKDAREYLKETAASDAA